MQLLGAYARDPGFRPEGAEKAKSLGALHHRFGIGDGYIHVIDEWDSPANFEAFFADPSMQEFIGTIGADTSVEPDITISQSVDSADAF